MNIIVVINRLIKIRHIIPIDLINAILVAKCFIKHVFKLYRLPNLIILLATQSIKARARQEGRASLYDWIVYK